MLHVLKTLALCTAAIFLTAVGLVGCSTFSAIVGEDTSADIRTHAEYVFEGFNTVWIPLLEVYRSQPKCGDAGATKPLCWEPEVYAKLHYATDVATACMLASTAPGIPLADIQLCVVKVEAAKGVLLNAGLKPPQQESSGYGHRGTDEMAGGWRVSDFYCDGDNLENFLDQSPWTSADAGRVARHRHVGAREVRKAA